jgi:hypothetical protein
MLWSADLRALQAGLSTIQVDFLDFIVRHPEGLSPEGFGALTRRDEFMRYPMQPWPMFLSSAKQRQMADVARRIYDLIRSIPQRVFGNDPARLADFYGIDPETAQRVSAALQATGGARGLLARGDFIDTPAGFRCIEFNIVSNLGGWGHAVWADRYRQVPLIERFLAESGVRVTCTDPALAFFRNVVDQARHSALDGEGELNVAFLVGETQSAAWMEYVESAFRQARHEQGGPSQGEVLVCDVGDLQQGPRGLSWQDRRVHAAVELSLEEVPEVLVAAQRSGRTHVYNGPASRVLTDKANLAILSQMADSDLLSREEREVIRVHVPWTRQVAAVFTDRGGERVYLPDHLLEQREGLVLKRGYSIQGRDVCVGRFASAAAWEARVERALEEGGWIVQERLEFLPYLFQAPAGGVVPHDVVWGLFVFGEHYGGGFTRMTPRDSTGVINAARGATEGALLEVLDAESDGLGR